MTTAVSVMTVMFRGVVLRPLDVLVKSIYIILGRTTPAALQGGPVTALLLLSAWFGSSLWFDTTLPAKTDLIWYAPAFEVVAWILIVRHLLSRHGDIKRFGRTILSLSGVSTIFYLLAGAALASGAIQHGYAVVPFMVIHIRGIGVTLKSAFDDRISYQFAFGTTMAIALFSFASRLVVLEVLR